MTDRVTRLAGPRPGKPGPVHAMSEEIVSDLTWCGIRPQFRHWQRGGTEFEVTCARCKTALKQNRPRAWRRR